MPRFRVSIFGGRGPARAARPKIIFLKNHTMIFCESPGLLRFQSPVVGVPVLL